MARLTAPLAPASVGAARAGHGRRTLVPRNDRKGRSGRLAPGRRRGEEGTVTAFAVVVAVALLLCLGLVVDAGRLVDARVEAGDLAGAAARAGAQEVADLRTGGRRVDPARAVAAAQSFLAGAGASGRAAASPTQVTVTVQVHRRFTLLGLAGIAGRTVTATRTAAPVAG